MYPKNIDIVKQHTYPCNVFVPDKYLLFYYLFTKYIKPLTIKPYLQLHYIMWYVITVVKFITQIKILFIPYTNTSVFILHVKKLNLIINEELNRQLNITCPFWIHFI